MKVVQCDMCGGIKESGTVQFKLSEGAFSVDFDLCRHCLSIHGWSDSNGVNLRLDKFKSRLLAWLRELNASGTDDAHPFWADGSAHSYD